LVSIAGLFLAENDLCMFREGTVKDGTDIDMHRGLSRPCYFRRICHMNGFSRFYNNKSNKNKLIIIIIKMIIDIKKLYHQQ
jgi:hypothetical protein